MIHEVEISREVARLAQFRTRATGAAFNNELARNVVQEAIYNCDPEQGLMVEEDAAYSSDDALVVALGVNDVVINGNRLDVRPVDEDGRVAINRALVGTNYMTAGTLAVALNGNLGGKVVGFVPASEWAKLDGSAGDQQVLYVKPAISRDFDVVATVAGVQSAKASTTRVSAPDMFELATFIANRSELSIDKQRRIVDGTLMNESAWENVSRVVEKWSTARVRRVLSDGASWNARVERIAALVTPRFKRLPAAEVKAMIARIGETCGGQPESPTFRKVLLSALTREELSRSLAGSALKKASDVAEAVLSGRAVGDAIKDVAKNPVAVQIATQIKRQRQKVQTFVDATSAELSGAFQQVALQPAYSTHSADPASGLDSINEALKMLDAGELAESIKELDNELSSI